MGYEDDGEMKVRKVMGKLHNEIRRVLRDQETMTQTYAAMPILRTRAPPAVHGVAKSLGTCARQSPLSTKLRVFVTRPRERGPTGGTQVSPT